MRADSFRPVRGLAGFGGALLLLLTMAGCTSLPTFEAARDETRDQMQTIVDLLPEGSVDHVEDPIPAGYVSCNGGKRFTGRWLVYLEDPTKVERDVVALREAVAEAGFVEDPGFIDSERRFAVRLNGDPQSELLSVWADEDVDGTPHIRIISFARCSQPPEHAE